jgi:hypothetical protein
MARKSYAHDNGEATEEPTTSYPFRIYDAQEYAITIEYSNEDIEHTGYNIVSVTVEEAIGL